MASVNNDGHGASGGEAFHSQTHPINKPDGSQRLHASSPPTYEEAMDPAGEAPPSYESLFGRVKEVHKESSGTVDFIKNVIALLLGTIGCTIMVGVTIVIPLGMLIIGAVYLNECPANKYIPIYLLVGGIFGCLKQLLNIYERTMNCGENDPEGNAKSSNFQNLIGCFMVAWFIAGSYWVYSLDKPNFKDFTSDRYCSKTVYYFAYWQVTFIYIMMCFFLCCFCLFSGGLVMFARRLESNETTP